MHRQAKEGQRQHSHNKRTDRRGDRKRTKEDGNQKRERSITLPKMKRNANNQTWSAICMWQRKPDH